MAGKTTEVKEKPSLGGGRSLFHTPTEEKYENDGIIYYITPLKMMARKRWANLSAKRYAGELTCWGKEEYKLNPYIRSAELVDVKYGGELDPVIRQDIWSKAIDIMAEDEAKLIEFSEVQDLIKRGRFYAFSQFSEEDWLEVYSLICKSVMVDDNGTKRKLTRDVIENAMTFEDLAFVCGKIDDVSNLNEAEALGLE